MADITEIRLPDSSVYNIKDASALHPSDIVDTLTSTATNAPLSANQGRVLSEELSHRNLLDNSWFTVNQRGATTVTSGYGADRWKYIGGNEAVFSSSGVTLNSVLISQFFEKQLPNGVYTASALFSDGTIRKGTATKSNDSSTVRFVEDADFKLTYEPSLQRFDINTDSMSSGLTVRAVKLEVGSFSTLHLDVAPDYTTELLKCQRHLAPVGYCTVIKNASGTYTGMVHLPVPMRGTPSIPLPALSNVLWAPGLGTFTPDTVSFAIQDMYANSIVAVFFSGASLTEDSYIYDGKVLASAEL